MDYKERGFHALCAYDTQDTSRMRTTRVKQEEHQHHNHSKRVVRNLEEWKVGTKGKNLKQDLASTADPTIYLLGGHESPYHTLD